MFRRDDIFGIYFAPVDDFEALLEKVKTLGDVARVDLEQRHCLLTVAPDQIPDR